MLTLLFARRYLFSRKSRSVVNLIAALSVVAVAIPVAAMIVLLSVINGFEGLIRESGSRFEADLRILPRTGRSFALGAADTAALSRTEGLAAWSAILEERILLEANGRQATATLRGADDRYDAVLPLEASVTAGEPRLRLGQIDYLLLGRALASRLAIRSHLGSEVRLYAVRRNSFSSLLPFDNYTLRTLPVGGLYEVDYNTENEYLVAPLRAAQELLDRPDRASAILVRAASAAPAAVERLRRTLGRELGEEFRIESREERSASIYRLVRYEKWGVFFIALMVLVDAAFSIVGALSMLILEKRSERATLRALGATEAFVRAIFRREGYLICALGGVIGLLAGVGLSLLQQHFGLIQIPADSFLTKSYPIAFRTSDLLVILPAFALVAWSLTALTVHNMLKKEPTP